MQFQIEENWKKNLLAEFEKPYFKSLYNFIQKEYLTKNIFPPSRNIFWAFTQCPFEKVKVVIIGQDPYHEHGQAHGLCFSVPDGTTIPPSLANIHKEIENDLGIKMPNSGDLTSWAKQGVLLLNATLTVEAHKAGSHQKRGWEEFTDNVIKILSAEKENLVFLLWGAYAQNKAELIDASRHLILKAPHPSPLSAHRGFFGSKHFSKTNLFLKSKGIAEIKWDAL
jgi:uracil-DNA glycosylase